MLNRADEEKVKGNLKDVAYLLEEAFIMCQEEAEDDKIIMELANKTAMAFLATGEIRRSIDYFHEALNLGKEINDVVRSTHANCCQFPIFYSLF